MITVAWTFFYAFYWVSAGLLVARSLFEGHWLSAVGWLAAAFLVFIEFREER